MSCVPPRRLLCHGRHGGVEAAARVVVFRKRHGQHARGGGAEAAVDDAEYAVACSGRGGRLRSHTGGGRAGEREVEPAGIRPEEAVSGPPFSSTGRTSNTPPRRLSTTRVRPWESAHRTCPNSTGWGGAVGGCIWGGRFGWRRQRGRRSRGGLAHHLVLLSSGSASTRGGRGTPTG